jgi:hypothetical protein
MILFIKFLTIKRGHVGYWCPLSSLSIYPMAGTAPALASALCPLPFVPKQEFGKRDFCLLDLRYSSGPMFTLLSVNYSLTFTVI